jgi:toxin ParE1/3/4
VRLRYTRRATAELEAVLDYIAERSPQGSRHVQARIRVIIDLLLRHPGAGQLTSKRRLRRMIVSPYPYVVFTTSWGTRLSFTGYATAHVTHRLHRIDFRP